MIIILKKFALLALSATVLFYGFIVFFGYAWSTESGHPAPGRISIILLLLPIFAIQNLVILFREHSSKTFAILTLPLPILLIYEFLFWTPPEDLFKYTIPGCILYLLVLISNIIPLKKIS